MPSQVFHAAADLPLAEAEVLVGRALDIVTDVTARRIRELLAGVGPVDAVGVVAGDRPVPQSVSAVLASHVLMHAAEGQIYRDALLDAAASIGLPGIELARKEAAARLGATIQRVRRRRSAPGARPPTVDSQPARDRAHPTSSGAASVMSVASGTFTECRARRMPPAQRWPLRHRRVAVPLPRSRAPRSGSWCPW